MRAIISRFAPRQRLLSTRPHGECRPGQPRNPVPALLSFMMSGHEDPISFRAPRRVHDVVVPDRWRSQGRSSLRLRGPGKLERSARRGPRRLLASDVLKLPDVKVSEAVAVPAPAAGPITVAHCRVAGVIGTEINVLRASDRMS